MSSGKRIEAIDITKGIGFFLMVFGHFVEYGGALSAIIYAFHMPLFYMMSGYVMPSDSLAYRFKPYLKRFVTFVGHYIAFCLIGLVVTLIVPSTRRRLTPSVFVQDVLLRTTPDCLQCGQIWFLISMVWAVGLFYIIHKLLNNKEIPCLIVSGIVAAISIVSSIGGLRFVLFGSQHTTAFCILSGMCGLIFMEFGFIMKQHDFVSKVETLKIPIRLLIAVALMALTVCIALINRKPEPPFDEVNIGTGVYNNVFFYFVASIGGTLSVLIFSTVLKGKVGRCISYYGKNTLCFFPIHFFFIAVYLKIAGMIMHVKYNGMGDTPLLICLLGTVFIILIVIPTLPLYKWTIGRAISWINNKIDQAG